MKKKLLSIVLSAALVFGSVNITTLAAEMSPQETEDTASTVLEAVEEEQEEPTAGDAREGDEQAKERENVGLETEEPTVQTTKEQSDEEAVKQSAQENLRDDAEGAEGSKTAFSLEDDSEIIVVEGELEGVYQFGDAPSERKAAAFSMRAAEDEAAAEEYIYEQMKQRKAQIDLSDYSLPYDTAKNILIGVINEHPDLYFVEKKWSYSLSMDGTICTSIMPVYSSDNTLDDDAFKKGVEAALSVVKPGMSDLEKAIVLHDYLAVNCEYDYDNYLANKVPGISHSAYGPLVKRTSVCDGYALAYKYLLSLVGIDCYMVTSDTMNHAWNLIVLDGNYYQVDVTWDDPTRDLVGRARHEYMFCSDAEFKSKKEPHKNWKVTDGAYVVNYQATDTLYDNAFWKDVNSPLVLSGDSCYYTTYDSTAKIAEIKKTNLDDITVTGEDFCSIGKWFVWGNNNSFWSGAYSGLFCVNNRLYYNNTTSIYSIALDDITDKKTEFTADTSTGYIYGSALRQGKVYYSLHQTPNLTQKETVLVADIQIPVEKPEEEESSKSEESSSASESSKAEESSSTQESGKTEESSGVQESSKAEESSSTPESSKAEESSGTQESGKTEESSSVQESSKAEESSDAQESSKAEESSSAQESSKAEESSGTQESSKAEESSGTQESGETEESSGVQESSKAEESSSTPESSKEEESSSTPESSKAEESSGTQESSKAEESSGTQESSKAEESSGTQESSKVEESSGIENSESDASEPESKPESDKTGIRIVGLESSYQYTGDKITPAFDVIDYDISGGKLLVLGVDYTVTYKDNKDPGTAVIIVKGKGNYAADKRNEAKETFKIVVSNDVGQASLANIKGAKINKLDDVDYNGAPQNPSTITLTLKDKDKTPVLYTYNTATGKYTRKDGKPMDVNIAVSNNINKGTASVLVSGVDDKGKPINIKGKFKIKPFDLSSAKVEAKAAKYAVNGAAPAALTVKVDVKIEGKTKELALKCGKDYTVKYSNNKNAGVKAAVIVSGKGNYTKKASAVYDVAKADMSDFKVAAVTACDGIKKGKIKAVVVDKNGNALNIKQYDLVICHVEVNGRKGKPYEDNESLKGGDSIFVKAVVKDTVNLKEKTETADVKFTVGTDISKAKFTLKKGLVKTYKGEGIEVKLKKDDFDVTIKAKGEKMPKTLTMNEDYKIVSYANNVNKGTATAVIIGIGEYSGTKTIKFKISQKPITYIKR